MSGNRTTYTKVCPKNGTSHVRKRDIRLETVSGRGDGTSRPLTGPGVPPSRTVRTKPGLRDMIGTKDIRVFGLAGTRVEIAGQQFAVDRIEPYTRTDGRPSQVVIWSGACSTCGASFEQMLAAGKLPVVKRCPEHRSPGKRAGRIALGLEAADG